MNSNYSDKKVEIIQDQISEIKEAEEAVSGN